MKVEKEDINSMSLDRETQMLDELKKLPGIPKIIWAGNEHNHNCLVMQLLGRDLSYHLKALKRFSLKCVVNISLQIIQIIEGVHKKGIIHRDMKPENVMTGKDFEQNSIFLADFGIAKFYRDANGTHVPFKENKSFVGTTRYASIGAHRGYELSRKDDLESIGYMIIYMYKGILPWQIYHNVAEKEKTKIVGQIKQQTQIEELCNDCPQEFYLYFQYVKQLEYKSTPDYRYLHSLFEQISINGGFKNDKRLDWTEYTQGTTKISGEQIQQETKQPVRSSRQNDKFQNVDQIQKQRSDVNNLQKTINNNRNRSRHQSEQQVNKNNTGNSFSSSQINSQQSSILLNYQNSQISQNNIQIGSSKLLTKLQDRGIMSLHQDSKGSLIKQQSSKSFRERHMSSHLQQQFINQQQQSFHNNSQIMKLQQEDFQDLEELEERLQKDKQSKWRNQIYKKNQPLKVKEIQKNYKQLDNQTDLQGMTQIEDTNIENKVMSYTLYTPKLKQNLAKY
ncbi:unnamed protein product [Paramecium sonneborni]|uniref:Casein kinase I n=1 Tax=Paramecium sonneborni TaxID=65129 RepID=A0A8S1L662_9CILI|nr:unnamed protein product [Paramecium sonneborni]